MNFLMFQLLTWNWTSGNYDNSYMKLFDFWIDKNLRNYLFDLFSFRGQNLYIHVGFILSHVVFLYLTVVRQKINLINSIVTICISWKIFFMKKYQIFRNKILKPIETKPKWGSFKNCWWKKCHWHSQIKIKSPFLIQWLLFTEDLLAFWPILLFIFSNLLFDFSMRYYQKFKKLLLAFQFTIKIQYSSLFLKSFCNKNLFFLKHMRYFQRYFIILMGNFMQTLERKI